MTEECTPGSFAGFHDWKAVRNGARLRVSGVCVFPTSGYGAELRRHEPQDGDSELLLDLIVDRPTGIVLQVVSGVKVAYEEEADASYERVTILPDGPRGVHVDDAPADRS